MNKDYPKGFWKGLLVIVGAYTLVQFLVYVPNEISQYAGVFFRQVLRWIQILIVYATGAIVLHRMEPRWIGAIWHFIHFMLIGFLAISAIIEFSIGPVPYAWRASIAPMIEFLISPVLYFGAGVLYNSMKTT